MGMSQHFYAEWDTQDSRNDKYLATASIEDKQYKVHYMGIEFAQCSSQREIYTYFKHKGMTGDAHKMWIDHYTFFDLGVRTAIALAASYAGDAKKAKEYMPAEPYYDDEDPKEDEYYLSENYRNNLTYISTNILSEVVKLERENKDTYFRYYYECSK